MKPENNKGKYEKKLSQAYQPNLCIATYKPRQTLPAGAGALLTTSNTTRISRMLHYLPKSCLIFGLLLYLLKTTANQWTPQSQAFIFLCSSCPTPGVRDTFLDHLYWIYDLATSALPPPPQKTHNAKHNKGNQSVTQTSLQQHYLVRSKPKVYFDAITPLSRK